LAFKLQKILNAGWLVGWGLTALLTKFLMLFTVNTISMSSPDNECKRSL